MKKFLITLNDLCHILNKKDVEILNFIDEGMPHYYYHDVLYFEYDEVQDWIIKRIDLGVAGLNIHTLVTYLKRCMDCEIKPSTLFSKIREYKESGNPSNPVIDKLYYDFKNNDTHKIYGTLKYLFPDMSVTDSMRYYLMVFKDRLEKGLI